MTRTHTHHGPTQVLRELSRVFRSKADSLERVDSARVKQPHAAQVQFVRSFRM